MGQIMKNLLASLGIITVLCFFPVSETSAYHFNGIAFEGNYVWCATDSGLVKMNKLDGTYQVYSIFGSKIVVDSDNIKWLDVNEGVISFDELELKSYTTDNGLADNDVKSIAIDHNNVKWFATLSGVSSFDGAEWKTFTTKDGLVVDDVESIAVDHNNVKWFGTRWGGVSSFNDTTWTTHQFTFNDTTFYYISSIAVDSENVVWFGGERDGKHVLISLEGTSLTLHYNTFGTGWEYYHILDITCGLDNKIWYIHYPFILMTYDKISGNVRYISNKEYKNIATMSARAVSVDNEGIVWLASEEGLRSFNGETWTPYTFDFSVTGVEAPETLSPFSIRGAYPNPFNASTTISFTLPASGFTQLVIYNITGQKVRELAAGEMKAGTHSIIWNGCDDNGTAVSSGIYILRLKSGKLSATGRMLLMK